MTGTKRAAATRKKTYIDEEGSDDDFEINKARADDDVQQEHDEEGDDSDDFVEAPAPKRARTALSSTSKGKGKAKATGRGRGNAGRLEYFKDMPVDILCEIASHSDPATLLSLARSCKMFRDVFMAKSSKPIWALARKNVFLPDMTAEDFSEAALASLVYDRNCLVCGKGRAVKADWLLRARFCVACQKKNVLNPSKLTQELGLLHPNTLSCSLFTKTSATGRSRSGRSYYFKPDVVKMNDTILALGGNHVKLQEFVTKRERIVTASQTDGAALLQWERSSDRDRRDTVRISKDVRRQAIYARLRALGHEDRDLPLYNHSLDQTAPLTDAIWNRIKDELIQSAEQRKRGRLNQEEQGRRRGRQALVRSLYDEIAAAQRAEAPESLFIAFHTFCNIPTVLPFWEPDQPDDYLVDKQQWLAKLDETLVEIGQLKRDLKLEYFRYLAKQLSLSSTPLSHELVAKAMPPPTFPAPAQADTSSQIDPVASTSALDEDEDFYDYSFYGSNFFRRGTRNKLPAIRDLLQDPPITDDEMDPIFAKFAHYWSCNMCSTAHAFPQIISHVLTAHLNSDSLSPSPYSVNITHQWIDNVNAIQQCLNLSDHDMSTAKLEAMGPKFECVDCDNDNHWSMSYYGHGILPKKTTELSWSQVLLHLRNVHSHTLRYGSSSKFPKIGLVKEKSGASATDETVPVASTSTA